MKRKSLILLAALSAFVTAAPSSAQSVRDGIAAWQASQFARAVEIWRPLATKGDADAAFNLGQAYRLGKGVPLSLSSAQTWYARAAKAGHVDAATSLGILLFQNGDRDQAMIWLRQAADAGEPRALLLFGTALFNGDGVPVDRVLAYAYVSRAAAQGLAPARATLADMDAMIPLGDRQRGLAIARAKAVKDPRPVKAEGVATRPKPPVPAPRVEKPAQPKDGGWRVQLGAFSKRSSAEALFRSLAATLPDRQAYYSQAGTVTRLQAGPFANKTEASAACARLAGRGQACFPVPAR